MGNAGTLDLTLPSEPGSVAEARTRVLEAMAAELDQAQEETLRLLVSEVVTNAVRHGGDRSPVEVHAHWNSEVRIEVIDHGDGFTPGPRAGALDEPGGFGLFLVGRLADRWGVETHDATCVWFVLRRDWGPSGTFSRTSVRGPTSWKVTEVADLRGDRLLVVHGELDIATAPELARLLTGLREREHAVMLDLSEVTFVDSTGLSALMDAYFAAERTGWEFSVRHPSAAVRRVVELAGVGRLFGD